jgi:adenylosuccinate lyase
MQAGARVKQEGLPNNLIDLIADDSSFGFTKEELLSIMDPSKFTGRAGNQTREFIENYIKPILEDNKDRVYSQKVDIDV